MQKNEMIKMMLDNNYPDAWARVPSWMRKRKSTEECRACAEHDLQYHVLKEQVCKMFKNYLLWKIEKSA